jgi:hypothetical protein
MAIDLKMGQFGDLKMQYSLYKARVFAESRL